MNTVEDRLRAALQAKSDGLRPLDPPLPAPESDEVVRLLPMPAGGPPRRWTATAVAALVVAAVAITVGVTVSRSGGSTPAASLRTRTEIPWSQVGDGWALVQTNPPYTYDDTNQADQLDLVDPAGARYLVMDLTGKQWELSSWTMKTGTALLVDHADTGNKVASIVQLNLRTGQHQEFATASDGSLAQYAGPNGSAIVYESGPYVSIASLDGHHVVTLPTSEPSGTGISTPNPVVTRDKLLVVGSDTGVAVFTTAGTFVRDVPAPPGYTGCRSSGPWSTNSVTAVCATPANPAVQTTNVIFPLDGTGKSRVIGPPAGPPWQFWNLAGGQLAYRQDQGLGGEFARVSADGTLTSIPLPSVLQGKQWEVHGAGGSYVSIQFWTDYSKQGLLSFDPFTGKATVLYAPGTAHSRGPIISAPWNFPPYLAQ